MDDFSQKLQSLRLWNNAGKISFLLIFPAWWLHNWLAHQGFSTAAMLPLAMCIASFLYFPVRICMSQCPRCGKLFNVVVFAAFNQPTGRACGHCGLSADTGRQRASDHADVPR